MCTAMARLEEECRQRGFKNGLEAGREAGRKAGMEEGIKEGRKEGIKEGRKEGIEQGILKKAKELAIKLYKKGNSLEAIAELVEVQVPQIEEWIKEES